MLDARPLQAPDRSPLAAAYLDGLLGAYDADPLDGESFAFLLASDLDDPTDAFGHLDVVGRRQLPPTRLLRSGAMTVDPFVLRGAAVGAAWRAERGGAAGAVYHAVGGGPLPIASGIPVVVTLLDLAPWELPEAFGRTVVNRFGQRLRAQLLREAAAVIVGSEATARAARRVLRIRRDRLHVVPLAPRAGVLAAGRRRRRRDAGRGDRCRPAMRLGLDGRYLVFTGRFDARLDLGTLLSALADLAPGRPARGPRRGRSVAAAHPRRRAPARTTGPRSRGPPPARAIGESLVYAPACRLRTRRARPRRARRRSCRSCPRRPGCRSSRRSPAGSRSSRPRSGRSPSSSARPVSWSSPATPDRLAVALATIWADDDVHDRIGPRPRGRPGRDARPGRMWPRDPPIYAAAGLRLARLGAAWRRRERG